MITVFTVIITHPQLEEAIEAEKTGREAEAEKDSRMQQLQKWKWVRSEFNSHLLLIICSLVLASTLPLPAQCNLHLLLPFFSSLFKCHLFISCLLTRSLSRLATISHSCTLSSWYISLSLIRKKRGNAKCSSPVTHALSISYSPSACRIRYHLNISESGLSSGINCLNLLYFSLFFLLFFFA